IKVFQGESRYVRNNVFLDQYSVDGIPPAKGGPEKVAIGFTYDINGILKVTTKILSTGKEAHLVVDRSPQRMSEEDRVGAKARLEREWGGGAAAPAGAGPTARPAPASHPAPAAPSPDTLELLEAARKKAGSL